jgi:hypothetical protein
MEAPNAHPPGARERSMTKREAERLFQVLDWINEQIENARDEIQWNSGAPRSAADKITDQLGRVSDALGEAGWAIREAYQLPELVD